MIKSVSSRRTVLYVSLFVIVAVATIGVAALLININARKQEATQFPLRVVEIEENELDPAVWGANFPMHYDSFMRTQEDYGQTPYGGSDPYSKIERFPAMERLWAGYAFSIDHNEERGHFYAQIDQAETERVKVVSQPGACANCHAAETPQLIEEMSWETFNSTPYNDLVDKLHFGSSCADCHDPDTMALRITRPALRNALERQGVDIETISRQDMRTYVCAQCHVEYYFQGEDKLLTFPWDNGLNVDEIETYYTEAGFTDWTHKESGAPMIKIQHPEYELYSSGIHAASGVACADCHMPYVREGAMKISDHWLRSPLEHVDQSCQTCHGQSEEELTNRVISIQNKTAELLRLSEHAILDAIDAIVAARAAGADDTVLDEALQLHRSAQLRWDFVSSENSTGFHSPQEAARILGISIDMARQSQLKAIEAQMQMASGEAEVVLAAE